MNEITIIHHLGLGDHIMLNGMARFMSSKGYKVNVVVRKNQSKSVKFMYRDSDISVLVIQSDDQIRNVIKGVPVCLATYGFDTNTYKYILEQNIGTWASVPYFQAGVNPEYMRTRFKVDRDYKREETFMKVLGVDEEEEFIFLHDASTRLVCPDINTSYKIIKAGEVYSDSFNIFDWLGVLEKAKEIHCVNSSFAWIVELCGVGKRETNFLHIKCAHQEHNIKSVKSVFTEDRWTFID